MVNLDIRFKSIIIARLTVTLTQSIEFLVKKIKLKNRLIEKCQNLLLFINMELWIVVRV